MQFFKYIKSLKFKFLVHLILIIIVFFNLSVSVDIQKCKFVNTQLLNKNQEIQLELELIATQKAYQTSDLYKEKEIKTRNYKFFDEIVYDISSKEILIEKTKDNFIPKETKINKNNWQLWYDYLKNFTNNQNNC